MMKNWRARDFNLYDDFRPIYEPLNLDKKLNINLLAMHINQDGLRRRLTFHLFEK